ncbi:MAG TPA: cell wall metabolism sensor histidine kinase WalK [Epulopiscium sp.]|nr:cell wall metabolism sensor histidine kinase WalK [Candidatus Epulonipiscium sp.]
MGSSIQWKLVSIYLSVVLVVMIASGSFILYSIEQRQYEDVQKQLKLTADTVELQLELKGTEVASQDRFKYLVEKLKESIYPYQQEVYIIDAYGSVIIGTGNKWKQGSIIQSGVVIQALSSKKGVLSDIPRFFNSATAAEYMDYAKPILRKDTKDPVYIIYVTRDTTEIYENMQNIIITIGFASIIAIAIAGVLGFIFSRMITEPIKQLTRGAKELAGGQIHHKIPVESTDEIGQLTGSFNYMAQELSRTLGNLSNEKTKLETILSHMADGVLAFNRQGVLIHANPATYEILGIRQMDHRFDDIFPGIGVRASFDALLEQEVFDVKRILIEYEKKYINIYFAPYQNRDDEPEGMVVVLQDVTKQQKLDQMRKEFVANVSHELRTPLTTVKGYAETLADGAVDDKEVAVQFLNVIISEADRMTALVKDLLELSRLDNKQVQLDITDIDLAHIIKQTVSAYDLTEIKNGQEISVDCHQDKILMEADSARVKQVLHNIISNAIKYNTGKGKIRISTSNHGEYIEVKVADTGVGIPERDMGRIFERFYRVDKARSGTMRGTGLGLSITKEIMELHGGEIWIASKLGRGTTVTMYFPKKKIEPEQSVKQ